MSPEVFEDAYIQEVDDGFEILLVEYANNTSKGIKVKRLEFKNKEENN